MKDVLTLISKFPRFSLLLMVACWGLNVQAQTFTFPGGFTVPDNTCTFAAAMKSTTTASGLTSCHRLARVTLTYTMDWQTDVYYGLQAPGGRRISLFTGSGWIAAGTHTFNFNDTALQSATDAGFFLNANPYKPDAQIGSSSWSSRNGVGCSTDFNPQFCSLNDLTSTT
ncbi:MAG: hypothetical protein WAT16_00730, partial [Saprospiraceae bacterium]